MPKGIDKNQDVSIGIDSHCLSYLIDAVTDVSEPTDVLSYEKKALLRMYLYLPDTLYVTPIVLTECAAIRNEDRRKLHASFCNVLFSEVPLEDESQVEISATNYQKSHTGKNDCRIFSEAVHGNL